MQNRAIFAIFWPKNTPKAPFLAFLHIFEKYHILHIVYLCDSKKKMKIFRKISVNKKSSQQQKKTSTQQRRETRRNPPFLTKQGANFDFL